MKNWLLAESGLWRAGHADRAALELGLGEFRRDVGQVGFAGAGAGRIARLGHEAVDHPVKDDAVVKALLRQGLDLLHMLGREIGTQADGDAAVLGVEEDRVLRVGGLLAPQTGTRPASTSAPAASKRFMGGSLLVG